MNRIATMGPPETPGQSPRGTGEKNFDQGPPRTPGTQGPQGRQEARAKWMATLLHQRPQGPRDCRDPKDRRDPKDPRDPRDPKSPPRGPDRKNATKGTGARTLVLQPPPPVTVPFARASFMGPGR